MNKPVSRIRNLQALRIYAAIPVILYHTNFTLPGLRPIGLFGVHLFFLMSGYIMAAICDNDTTAFMRRRLIRVIPLYWTLTLILYTVAWKFPHLMGATQARPSELFKSLFFVPFVKSNGLYQPILFVGWTVNYEMFFYMTLALAVLINRRRAALLGASMVLSVMAFCSFFAQTSAIAKFYSDPVLLECVLGLAAYYFVRSAARRLTPSLTPVLLTLAIGSLVLLPVFDELHAMDVVPVILRFGPLCFLLISTACLLAFSGVDIEAKVLVLLGDASYVMYLTHPYIEEFLDRVVGKYLPIFHINTPIGCLIAMVFVLPISVFLYLKIDKPTVRYLNQAICGRKRTDPALAMSTVVADPVAPATDGVIARSAPVVREGTLA
jgi:exopolysaccharide production protein ExoZ